TRSWGVPGPSVNVATNAPFGRPRSRMTDPSVYTTHLSPGLVGGKARPYTRLSSTCVKGTTKVEFGRWARCLGWRGVGSSARLARNRSSALAVAVFLADRVLGAGAELMAPSHAAIFRMNTGRPLAGWRLSVILPYAVPHSEPIRSVAQMQPRL